MTQTSALECRLLGERQMGIYLPVVAWDHCPERGRDNGPILRVNSHLPLALETVRLES